MYMSPDRVKGTVSLAFGSRSQNVFSPNQVWEIDSMRVDIECKSERAGQTRLDRAFVIACIDIFTRRVMLKVSAHNNGEDVCLLIATAILKWGVPEHIRTDCGKEYLSRRVQRFLANLGVDTEDLRCLPGHPEQKPFVERFNRTFQHRDLVKNPFFVGHNVAERQTLRALSSQDRAGIELAMSIDRRATHYRIRTVSSRAKASRSRIRSAITSTRATTSVSMSIGRTDKLLATAASSSSFGTK